MRYSPNHRRQQPVSHTFTQLHRTLKLKYGYKIMGIVQSVYKYQMNLFLMQNCSDRKTRKYMCIIIFHTVNIAVLSKRQLAP